jgi:organic hydroperoxide reductase OsmC/OhrA
VDEASGVLARNAEGREAMTRVTLRPLVTFSGAAPSVEDHAALHEKAHARCFIANSVRSEIVLEPRIA